MVEAAIEGSKTKEMKSEAVMLTFFPKFSGLEVTACEFIFIVDRSGSMRGSYIKSASETLVLFLKSKVVSSTLSVLDLGMNHSFHQTCPIIRRQWRKLLSLLRRYGLMWVVQNSLLHYSTYSNNNQSHQASLDKCSF